MSLPPESPSRLSNTASLADALNTSLASCFSLYLKTKNFHWHVSGPHFRDYHLLLDQQATQIIAVTDAIAERVRKIGGTTVRSIGDVARRQTIVDNDHQNVNATDILAELRNDNVQLIETFRAVKKAADLAGDNATSGVVDDWTDQAEERSWFLSEAGRSS